MDKYPKVSIIIPTFNRVRYLQECVDSIIRQNYTNLEIVITDDNSTDFTEDFVKDYMKQYPFIKYVKNKKYPKGPNGNKNNGLDHCSGDAIIIFDDDDTMVDGALKLMIDKLLEGYDAVMGNCKIVSQRWDNGEFSGRGLKKDGVIEWVDHLCGKINGEFLILFKKSILQNKRFDTDLYGGEGILWRDIFRGRKVYYLHKAVRNYRIHQKSVTHNIFTEASKVIKNYKKNIAYYGEEMKEHCPCHLASLYKSAAYFAKLTSQYRQAFRYIITSIMLCPRLKSSYIMLGVMFFPKKIIPYLSKLRVYMKENLSRKFKA